MAFVLPEYSAYQHRVRHTPRFFAGGPLNCQCLQGYWPLAEGVGKRVIDASGRRIASAGGTFFNRDISARYQNASSMADDGYYTLDQGQVWSAISTAQRFTLAVWLRLIATPSDDRFIILLDSNLYLACNNSGHFFFTSDNANFVTADNIDYGDGFWHLHIITCDDTTGKYYIDNDFQEDSQTMAITLAGSHTLDLGVVGGAETLDLCSIFGLGIWSRVLSTQERVNLFREPYMMLADAPRTQYGSAPATARVPDLMMFLPM